MTHLQDQLNRALQIHQSGRISEAIDMYREILPYQKKNAYLHYMLGLAYLQIGQYTQATEELQQSLAENVSTSIAPFAHVNLGIALQNLKRYKEGDTSTL